MDGALQAAIQDFDKEHLKETTTVVQHAPVVAPSNNNDFASVVGAPDEEEVKEYHMQEEEFRERVAAFVALLRQSQHFVVYTGAGVSTAAKIPDYRGPKGVWTLKAKGERPKMEITLEQAMPTYTHMALVALAKQGLLKHVVSTNVDGLHRRSGLGKDLLSELHGNIYREVCSNSKCGADFIRPFNVTKSAFRRQTGRLCPLCNAKLVDSIVNFGEMLPEGELQSAQEHSQKADLTLVLGSSMRVSPACELPSMSYKQGNPFCICNLQKTPFDHKTERNGGLRFFVECDTFMRAVMERLGLEVPEWKQSEADLEAELMDTIVPDPDFDTSSVLSKYNVYSMADDGPPPPQVLRAIQHGFQLRHVEVAERQAEGLGRVVE
ncbi:Silent information regulator family protein [Balamuthia mandrillaris]